MKSNTLLQKIVSYVLNKNDDVGSNSIKVWLNTDTSVEGEHCNLDFETETSLGRITVWGEGYTCYEILLKEVGEQHFHFNGEVKNLQDFVEESKAFYECLLNFKVR